MLKTNSPFIKNQYYIFIVFLTLIFYSPFYFFKVNLASVQDGTWNEIQKNGVPDSYKYFYIILITFYTLYKLRKKISFQHHIITTRKNFSFFIVLFLAILSNEISHDDFSKSLIIMSYLYLLLYLSNEKIEKDPLSIKQVQYFLLIFEIISLGAAVYETSFSDTRFYFTSIGFGMVRGVSLFLNSNLYALVTCLIYIFISSVSKNLKITLIFSVLSILAILESGSRSFLLVFLLFQMYQLVASIGKEKFLAISLIIILSLAILKPNLQILKNLTYSSLRAIGSVEIIKNYLVSDREKNIKIYKNEIDSNEIDSKKEEIEINYNVPIDGRLQKNKFSDNTYIGLYYTNKMTFLTIITVLAMVFRQILRLKKNKKMHLSCFFFLLILLSCMRIHVLHLSIFTTIYIYILFNRQKECPY